MRKTLLLTLPMFFVLLSALGFGATYDATYDVYNVDPSSQWTTGDPCLDLDVVIDWNLGDVLNIPNMSVSCASADADLKCISSGVTQSVNNNKITGQLTDFGYAFGYQWIGSGINVAKADTNERNAVVTSEGRYVKYVSTSFSGQPTWCYNFEYWIKNATQVPYWEMNSSKEIFATTYTAQATASGTQYIYFDMLDAGVSFSAVEGMDWYFQNTVLGTPNCIRMVNATTERCHSGWTNSSSNVLSEVNYWECDLYSSDDWCEVNVPPQVHSLVAMNKTDGNINSKYGDAYTYMATQWLDNAYNNFDFYYIIYQGDYVGIGDVTIAPDPPEAEVQLNFTWSTSATADSRLQYRLAPLNNLSDISSWATLVNDTYVTSHFMYINATDVIDNYYYEWRVLSDKNGTLRSSATYNFSLGVAVAENITFASGSGGQINPNDYYYFDFETGEGVTCVNTSCGQSYHDIAIYIPQAKVSDFLGSDGIVYHDSEDNSGNTLDAVPCESYAGTYTSRAFFDVNQEVGYYDIFCFDQSTYHGGEKFYGAIKFTALQNESVAFYYVLYSTHHFEISNIEYPATAYGGEDVSITWETPKRADSNLTYRYRHRNSTDWTNWTSLYDDRNMYDHTATIDGSIIQVDYVFEFYATSTTDDNLTDTSDHYYFDVITAPYPTDAMGDAIVILAGLLGVPVTAFMVLISIIVSTAFAVISAMKGNSGNLGIVVFVSFLVAFTVFGWIPWWVAIILGVISAFIVAKFGADLLGGK